MRKGDQKKRLELWMTILILTGSFYIGRLGARMVQFYEQGTVIPVLQQSETTDIETPDGEADTGCAAAKVVIDAGHGGLDSGKIGINGVLEKDVNLIIAKKVQQILESMGIEVIMTRETDCGLYDETEDNKKQQDMKERVRRMNDSGGDLAVSIHQNSYIEEYVRGPQVFFYTTSKAGKILAGVMQDTINEELKVEKPRKQKANDMYYILRKTSLPTIIVECGFLSNAEEAKKLMTEEYQNEMAHAICAGVYAYLTETSVLR